MTRPTHPPVSGGGGTWRERRARARQEARRGHWAAVVAAVSRAARAAGGLSAVEDAGGDEPTLVFRLAHPEGGAEQRWARVSIWGAGILALELSGGFTELEFEVDDEDLPDLADRFVALAAEHLHGRSREVEVPRRDGSPRRFLEVVLDGEVHRVQEEPEPLFGSCQEALLGLPLLLVRRLLGRRR